MVHTPRQAAALALTFSLGLMAGPSAVLAEEQPAEKMALPPAMAEQPDFRQIVQEAKDKVFPAVVYIRVLSENNVGGKKETLEASGSGVVISAKGEVLTNWHVIDKAQSVRCLLSDGRHYPAEIIGSDKDTDLALIQLQMGEGEEVPVAELGDSTVLREGDFVMAMGAPWGLNRSVSMGIVSCTSRYLEEISEYALWIQTDAPINPGNSGGPLVNTAGQIIGINARGMDWAQGMGFAIPSETVAVIVPQLREFKHVNWSWTGLQLQPLRDFNKDMYFDYTEGVIVAETDPDSPARRAGVMPRDRILAVNDTKLTALTHENLPAVNRVLGLLTKGEEAAFHIQRDGESLTIPITPREKGKVEGEELALKRWDFTVKDINQFDNPNLYFHRQKGVFVFGVRYPGNASSAGLSTQDIILKIGDEKVESIEDVKRAHEKLVAEVDKQPRVVITVLRRGLMRQVVLDFARDYERQ